MYHLKEFLENLIIKLNLFKYIPKLKDQTIEYRLHQLGYMLQRRHVSGVVQQRNFNFDKMLK